MAGRARTFSALPARQRSAVRRLHECRRVRLSHRQGLGRAGLLARRLCRVSASRQRRRSARAEDREKGFYSLAGALRYFLEDEIDVTHKNDMRDRILQGPPFSDQEKRDILDLLRRTTCARLARLFPHIIQTIRPPLEHAMFRSKFQWTIAQHAAPRHSDGRRLRWPGCGSTGRTCGSIWSPNWIGRSAASRWSTVSRIGANRSLPTYVRRNRMSWPTLRRAASSISGSRPSTRCAAKYPQLEPLRELRYSLSKLRLNDLAVGSDNRNRAPLWAYGTKTGAERARRVAVRIRPGQVAAVPDHAAARPRPGAS